MSEAKKSMARRRFLASLLMGAGTAAGMASLPEKAVARKERQQPDEGGSPQPILYRRTAEVERYYRTLYT
ncbi:MAG: hypothetical protein ACE147_02725 [Candidatus Methylomirabilales bacterium]